MAQYYLISQLPSLDGVSDAMPLPITEEAFLELCGSFLNKKLYAELSALSLVPPREGKKSASSLAEAFNSGERKLRFALASVRAEKLNKSFDLEEKEFSANVLSVANTAAELKNPLEAENFLNSYRLGFLESLRPMDNFSEEFLFYYFLKLKLLYRMRKFSGELGKINYKKIYNSILNGDRLEDIQ